MVIKPRIKLIYNTLNNSLSKKLLFNLELQMITLKETNEVLSL